TNYRDQIFSENTLVQSRSGSFLIALSFLATAFAISIYTPVTNQIPLYFQTIFGLPIFQTVIAISGFAISILWLLFILRNINVVGWMSEKIRRLEEIKPNWIGALDSFGKIYSEHSDRYYNKNRKDRKGYSVNYIFKILPLIFVGLWIFIMSIVSLPLALVAILIAATVLVITW
ncbi:MAG: hypothetical protein KGH72_03220, partial [Candidatus Micrarchaeota archaeon]|nr:hypothetical protein [Candidatus Micrarchaeota archaeon]